METSLLLTLGLCLLFAVAFGPPTAKSSAKREPIYGGSLAELLNLIASMLMLAVLPGVLGSIIFGAGPLTGLAIGVSFMVLTFICLLIFAIIEKEPREQAKAIEAQSNQEDEWTEADARTSGL